jgi:hypothetical protein
MRLRQAHRHVEVVGPGRERAREDRGHELRFDGVHHMSGPVPAGGVGDVVGVGCVDPVDREPGRDLGAVLRRDPLDRALRASEIEICDHHRLEERPRRCDLGNGISDAACADQEDSHG